jgi:molybdopterin-guanine dinucleotide biosynthesis protein A
MTSALLAGGRNTRFPTLKGFIDVGGTSIIERTLLLLRTVTDQTVISTDAPELYFRFGAPLVGDVVRDSGPMGGIVSVFSATGAEKVLVAACDMPFIHARIIKYIIENSDGEATVPLVGGEPEPLLALYGRTAADAMEKDLERGQRSLKRMLRTLNVTYLDMEDLKTLDPEGKSFININTPEDYKRAFGGQPVPTRTKEE